MHLKPFVAQENNDTNVGYFNYLEKGNRISVLDNSKVEGKGSLLVYFIPRKVFISFKRFSGLKEGLRLGQFKKTAKEGIQRKGDTLIFGKHVEI